jgi:hypothetical protein
MKSKTHPERDYLEVPTLASVPWLGGGKTDLATFLYGQDSTAVPDPRLTVRLDDGSDSAPQTVLYSG